MTTISLRVPSDATDRQAEQAEERGGVHAESDLVRVPCVDEVGHTLARARDSRVDFHALGVATAALHIAMQQMTIDRVKNYLGNLRAGGIIEEDEARLLDAARERANGFDRTGRRRLGVRLAAV